MSEERTLMDILERGITGLGFYYGDNNFNPKHDGYHLHGEISSYTIVKDRLKIKFGWSEILYNCAHGSDDWIPFDFKYHIVIHDLKFDQLVRKIEDKIYLREIKPVSKRKRNIDWTYIYFDTQLPLIKKAKC